VIWLVLIFLACVVVAAAGMRLAPPAIRRLVAILSLSLAIYLLFFMPAGGADNPLPLMMAFPVIVVAFGAAMAEFAALARSVLARRAPKNG
jgi:peptidoglycan/LPS O-acetylase OafA/YrhL